MAIYKPGSAPPASQVIDGLIYLQPPSATATVKQANNNRSYKKGVIARTFSPSGPGFLNMNNAIVAIDAAYDNLANQSDWDAYAASIAGNWDLCANCTVAPTAKKLYRQINFARGLTGQALENTPPSLGEFAISKPITGIYRFDTAAPPARALIGFPSDMQTQLATGQLGKLGGNPIISMNNLWNGVFVNSGDPFGFLTECLTFLGITSAPASPIVTTITLCWQNADGAPGKQNVMNLTVED